jgi:hypothetical protein
MEIDGLHHVALPCADLDRSRRFYVEVLGLTEISGPPCLWPERGSRWVLARNFISLLVMLRQRSGARKGWIPTTSTSPFGSPAMHRLWKRSEPRGIARTRALMIRWASGPRCALDTRRSIFSILIATSSRSMPQVQPESPQRLPHLRDLHSRDDSRSQPATISLDSDCEAPALTNGLLRPGEQTKALLQIRARICSSPKAISS